MKPRSRSANTHVTEAPPISPPDRFAQADDHGEMSELTRTSTSPLQNWLHFWLLAREATGLHAIRVLSGLLFLGWLLAFAGQVDALFGMEGWFDRQAFREVGRLNAEVQAGRLPPGTVPAPITWSLVYLCGANSTALHALYWGSVLVLLLFTLGVAPRLTSIGAYLVVASFIANPATVYDADYLMIILAFYLMAGYVFLGQWSRQLTLTERILGPWDACLLHGLFQKSQESDTPTPSHSATAALRLIQVHFCIAIVTAAVAKLQIGDWWSGVALWYPLHQPFTVTAETLKAYNRNPWTFLFFLSLAQYLVLAWQVFFPLFAWRDQLAWRIVLVGGAATGWLSLVLMFQLPLFGPVLFIACLSYLTAAEWRWLLSWQKIAGSVQRLVAPLKGNRRELARAGKR